MVSNDFTAPATMVPNGKLLVEHAIDRHLWVGV